MDFNRAAELFKDKGKQNISAIRDIIANMNSKRDK